jgi:putative transposase
MQNGYIERLNRIYRESILDAYLFFELDQVRTLNEEWIDEYNLRRPQKSLGNLTSNEWQMKQLKRKLSTFKM